MPQINDPKTTWNENDFRACCHHLGYDPLKLVFSDGETLEDVNPEVKRIITQSYDCEVEHSEPLMSTDVLTGVINVYIPNVYAGDERASLAHEIFHVCFEKAREAYVEQSLAGSGPLLERFKDSFGTPTNLLFDVPNAVTTDYSCVYMMNFKKRYEDHTVTGDDFSLLVMEILSEIAATLETSGTMPKSKVFCKFYRDIEQTAIELGVIKRA